MITRSVPAPVPVPVIDAHAIPVPLPDWTGRVVVLAGHDAHRTPVVLRRFLDTAAHVVLVSADVEASSRLRAQVQDERPMASIGLLACDADGGDGDQRVVRLGRRLAAIHPRVDVLVHSASLVEGTSHRSDPDMSPRARSAYALTTALAPALHASDQPRIVTVVGDEPVPTDPDRPAGQADPALGPLGFGLELHRRLREGDSHVTSIVADPGDLLQGGTVGPSAGVGPLMRRFAQHRASYGPVPEVRAAVDAEVGSGDVVAHSSRAHVYDSVDRGTCPDRSRAWEVLRSRLDTCPNALVDGTS